MASNLGLVTALAVSRDVFHAVTTFEQEEARLAPSRLYQYSNESRDYNEYGWMIRSLALYRAPGAEKRALCIMSAQGDVLFPHNESIQGRIVNADAPLTKGKRLGSMDEIVQIADHLYACGEGGQTYRRSDAGAWTIFDLALLDGQGDPDLPRKIIMPDGQPFGGRYGLVAKYPDLGREYVRRVIAADPNLRVRSLAGETEQRILAAGGDGRVLVWEGSGFRDIPTGSDKPLTDILIKDDHVLVCGRDGALLDGNEQRGFQQLPCARDEQLFLSVAHFNGLFYLVNNANPAGLFATDLARMEQVGGDLAPPIGTALSSVQAVDGVLWVFGTDDIVRYDGTTWTRIGLPPSAPRRRRRDG